MYLALICISNVCIAENHSEVTHTLLLFNFLTKSTQHYREDNNIFMREYITVYIHSASHGTIQMVDMKFNTGKVQPLIRN